MVAKGGKLHGHLISERTDLKKTSKIFQSTFNQRAATIVYTIRNPHPTVRFLRPSVVQSNITQEYGYGNQ